MISGKVDITATYEDGKQELLFSDDNLILDNAGDVICTMLTIPPDTSAVAPRIFDTSNFSIQAISFGKAGLNYFSNAHSIDDFSASGRDQNQIWIYQNPKIYNGTTYNHAPIIFPQEAPNPVDEKLTIIPPYKNVIVYPDGEVEETAPSGTDINILGNLVGWGQNNFGQVNIPPNIAEIKNVDSGLYHVAAITKNDRVVCWGRNQEGQSIPPLGLNNASTIAAGYFHTICSKKDGSIVSWGANDFNQRNLFVTTSSFEIFKKLSITNGHVIGTYDETFNLTPTSIVEIPKGWGSNSDGQINIPEDLVSGVIPEVAPLDTLFINSRDSLSLAIQRGSSQFPHGELFLWGGSANDPRRVGGTYQIYDPYTPQGYGQFITITVPHANYYLKVEIGPRHCLALRYFTSSPSAGVAWGGINDALVVWGTSGIYTQYPPYDLNLGRVIVPEVLRPISYTEISRIQIVKQTGNSRTTDRNRVYFTSGANTNLTYVVQWPQYTSGPVYTPWGYDFFVDPTSAVQDSGYIYKTKSNTVSTFPTFEQGSPNSVSTPAGWPSVTDLRIYPTYLPLNYKYLHSNIPPQVQGIVSSIYQGKDNNGRPYGVVLTTDGSAVKWGYDGVEWLGTGFTGLYGDEQEDSNRYWKLLKATGNFAEFPGTLPINPESIGINYNTSSVPTNIKKVDAGADFSIALKTDGKVYATNFLPVPETLNNSIITDIAAGAYHALALLQDKTVSAFGLNAFGQCDVPTGLTNVCAIAAGGYHSIALQSDGTVVCWGKNDYGQCDVPVGITANKISGGHSHTLISDVNGQLYVFGRNSEGQANIPEYADTSALDYTFTPKVLAAGGYFNTVLYDLNISSYAQISDTEIEPTEITEEQISAQVYNSLKNGQNVNLIPFSNRVIDKIKTSSGIREIALSANQCLLEGAFCPSTPVTIKLVNGPASAPIPVVETTVQANGDHFNAKGVMDFRGFVFRKAFGLSQTGASPTNGTVSYSTTIHPNDVLFSDLYGGITSLGLWSFNLNKMTKNGNLPPYTFTRFPTDNARNQYEDPIDFQLFAKKVYDVNITRQSSNPTNFLTARPQISITWTLKFM